MIFRSTTPTLSPKLPFMSAKDRENLNIFTVALSTVCQVTQRVVLTVKSFYLQRNKGPSVLLGARYNRVAIISHKSQRLI